MSYIFGIVDLVREKIKEEDLQLLDGAVKGENFVSQTEVGDHYAMGFSHLPDKDPRCSIFHHQHLVLLADLRIYNLDNLKAHFDFKNEYEAFAEAFLKWGIYCAEFINGEFAVIVIDQKNNEVHLIRDHIGARPLTYCYLANHLIFSSHEYGIAKSGLFPVRLSESKLIKSFFRFKSTYSQTPFENIFKVIPGHVVTISRDGVKDTAYWHPEKIKTNKSISFSEAADHLRQLLIKATLARLEPGKTGVHVSGGLDSTGIACILADYIDDKNRLIGYSWTPEELNDAGDDKNEKDFIDEFSHEKGILVRYLTPDNGDLARDCVETEFEIMYIEYPTIRMAVKDGVTTLFSGWGGDEFLSLSMRGSFNHFAFTFKPNWLLKYVRKRGIRSTIFAIRTEILPLLVPFGLLPTFRGTEWSNLKFFKASFIRKHWKIIFFHSRKNIHGYGSRKGFIINLLKNYHIPDRIDTWGFYAEKYGFEYKYPLLDKEVLDFWFSLPVKFTYENLDSRLLYRELIKGILTESIRTRRDKSETLRMEYSRQKMIEGKEYLESLFYNIPEKDHLPYFDLKAYGKLFDSDLPPAGISTWLQFELRGFYLRKVGLVKKYFSK
jgi:asparagine synthase (glutamine-hydrolysing)